MAVWASRDPPKKIRTHVQKIPAVFLSIDETHMGFSKLVVNSGEIWDWIGNEEIGSIVNK